MPVFRNGTRHPGQAAALTRRLADELAREQPAGQPVVYENRIGSSSRYNVTVIWDEWAGLDRIARSRVILDAYESADPSKTGQIAIAQGLTTAEAASMGLLPFAVYPHLDPAPGTEFLVAFPIEQDRRRAVLEQFGKEPGVTHTADGGLELRFRTLSEAAGAASRLRTTMPDVNWVVLQTIRTGAAAEEE